MKPVTPTPYVCRPLRTQLAVASNREFIRAWMARRAEAKKAAPAMVQPALKPTGSSHL